MQSIPERLDSIYTKVVTLVRKLESATTHVEQLKQENEALRKQVEAYKKQATHQASIEDIKQSIDQHIAEIDACIKLLE